MAIPIIIILLSLLVGTCYSIIKIIDRKNPPLYILWMEIIVIILSQLSIATGGN